LPIASHIIFAFNQHYYNYSGAVAIIDTESPAAPVTLTPGAHAAEAWCCCWLGNDVFASGADDCQFKLWDRRSPWTAISSVRCHDAGVTFLGKASFAGDGGASIDTFVSGSYDGSVLAAFKCFVGCFTDFCSTIKLWDARAIGPGSSKGGGGCLDTLEIDGAGVWDIDWMQEANGDWLGAVAGMCGGLH
jgi:WD40 repeat protein